jgi:tetratricopeptide (TPR) repeat protein
MEAGEEIFSKIKLKNKIRIFVIMLKPKKKISKKEIKTDPLITYYTQAKTFYFNNKKNISYGITGVVVVVLAFIFYMNNRAANDERASIEIGKIYQYFDQGNYLIAINGQPEKGLIGFKKIVEEYGSTHSGEMARFYLATAYYMIDSTDLALNEFDDVSFSDNLLQASVYAGKAACYERKENKLEAADYYDKAANKASDESITPEYLYHAATNYGISGKKERAVEILKRIKKEFPTHSSAREADRYIAEFSN